MRLQLLELIIITVTLDNYLLQKLRKSFYSNQFTLYLLLAVCFVISLVSASLRVKCSRSLSHSLQIRADFSVWTLAISWNDAHSAALQFKLSQVRGLCCIILLCVFWSQIVFFFHQFSNSSWNSELQIMCVCFFVHKRHISEGSVICDDAETDWDSSTE